MHAHHRCRDRQDWRHKRGGAAALPHTPLPPWQPPEGCTPTELFDHFISDRLPILRRHPLTVASAGTTDRIALIVEPRCHPALEHVVRNAYLCLGESWQILIAHGIDNEDHVRSCFTTPELSTLQLLNLHVDNLTRRAYSELLCSHWLWEQLQREHVLIFQTDSLLCRGPNAMDEFVNAYDMWARRGARSNVEQGRAVAVCGQWRIVLRSRSMT